MSGITVWSFLICDLLFLSRHTDSSVQPEADEFVDWVSFHATVCKHENVVQMLYCQMERRPMCLVLDAYSPGNLLHFLWTLRNVMLLQRYKSDLILYEVYKPVLNESGENRGKWGGIVKNSNSILGDSKKIKGKKGRGGILK